MDGETMSCALQREHDRTLTRHTQQITTLESQSKTLEEGIAELRRWIIGTLATSAGSLLLLVLTYLLGRK